jgi:hypothetical protein
MMHIAAFLFSPALMFNVAATVPTYNIKPTCRAAIELSGMAGRTAEMCEASEADARKEIVKAWSSFAESAKIRCIQTSAGHAPSYSELLTCLESMRDIHQANAKTNPIDLERCLLRQYSPGGGTVAPLAVLL